VIDLGEVRLDLEAGDHRYRHLDVRGNVKFVTDRDGAVVAHHLYGASGRRRTFGPSDDDRGFVGGSHVMGFVVVGGRILDPEAGRFLSPDPVPQLLDAYNYAWSNPVHYRDATGRHPSPDVPGAKALPVIRFFANFFLLTGTIFGQPANPEPISKALGITAFMLGLALDVVARDIEHRMRNHPSGRTSDLPPTLELPMPPVATPDVGLRCNDDGCFRYPVNAPDVAGAGGAISGGGGGFAGGGCGGAPAGAPGPCGLGAELAVILPFLLRWRRRRLA
jgi:RHS repeat-associated protein